MIAVAVAMRPQRQHLPRRGQSLVDQDGIVGHRLDHLQRQKVRIDRRAVLGLQNLLDHACPPRAPVLRFERRDPLFGAGLKRSAAGGLQRRNQRAQGLPDVGLQRDLGAVVLGEIPFDQADLHDRQALGLWIDLAVDRHPQRIGAEHDHQIVGRQHLADLLLQPRQRAHEARAFGEEMRAVRRRALIGGSAQRFRQRGGFVQRIALDDFVAGDDHGILRFEDTRHQRLQGFVGRFHPRIDPGRAAEFDAGLGIEDIAGQRDEHRPGRRRGRDLGGAAHDPRQVFQPRHLDRPLHHRLGHLHQRPIQHRLHQPVALLLLARGQDHRRAGEAGIV